MDCTKKDFFASKSNGCLTFSVALISVLFFAFPAFADEDLGASILSVVNSGYSNVPIILTYFSYIAGLMLGLIGLNKIKTHFVGGNQPLSGGLWHLVGASLLISLPTAWGMIVRSLKTGSVSGSTRAVADLSGAGGGTGSLSLDQMMIDLVTNIQAPMGYLLWSLSAVLGLFFLTTSFLRMAKNSGQDGPRNSLGAGTLSRVVIGGLLLSFSATADIVTTTLFGTNVLKFSSMDLSGSVDANALDHINATISAVLVFVQILGFIAFMRGFLMLRAQFDGGNGSTAAAFTHIIGGAVAFNISSFMGIMEKTFCATAGCSVFEFN